MKRMARTSSVLVSFLLLAIPEKAVPKSGIFPLLLRKYLTEITALNRKKEIG